MAAAPLLGAPPIVQLPDPAGCVSEDGTGGACANGVALDLANGVAVSPDGRNVYVASRISDAISIFDRDVVDGSLTQKSGTDGCIGELGTGGQCQVGVALDGAYAVVVSPDGRNVYATGLLSNSVLIYDRDLATGELLFKVDTAGCVSDDGTGDQCQNGNALQLPYSVAVSPDGRNVYVASAGSSAVTVFDRNSLGELTQKPGMAGCISEGGAGGCAPGIALSGASGVAVSPDGLNVYAIARASDSVVIFDRNLGTGALTQKNATLGCTSDDGTALDCVDGVALQISNDASGSVTVSPDGRNVYVAAGASNAVAVFDRNLTIGPLTGRLTQKAGLAACVSVDGTGGACEQGAALDKAASVVAGVDGRSVYVAASDASAVAVFDRDAAGALVQKEGVGGCVSNTGSGGCTDGVALSGVSGLAASPDGRNVYAAAGNSDAVAVFDREVASYDIDGDGESDALTDGLLLLRYLFGFTGNTLITGALDVANCTRCTAAAIEAYIEALLGL
jgi:DNA-binding beta-propeller fold protein YncE